MRFFLKAAWQDREVEVTKEQFVAAERNAGFRPKGEDRGQPATAGFGNGSVSGRVVYEDKDYEGAEE